MFICEIEYYSLTKFVDALKRDLWGLAYDLKRLTKGMDDAKDRYGSNSPEYNEAREERHDYLQRIAGDCQALDKIGGRYNNVTLREFMEAYDQGLHRFTASDESEIAVWTRFTKYVLRDLDESCYTGLFLDQHPEYWS